MNGTSGTRRRIAALSWLFGATALIAACGGGTDGAPPPVAGAPAPAPGPAPGPAPVPAPSPAPAPAPIAQTAAGDPEGLPTFTTIGAAGGTLASSDGRLRIDVPLGALTTDTEVGIQPITATAPGALGSAYRLTPEGATFAQPLTMTMTYSAEEAGAAIGTSLRVATHDANGNWVVADALHDGTQRQLSVATTHFSDWSFVAGALIIPAFAGVAVNKQMALQVLNCGEGTTSIGENPQHLLLECIVDDLPTIAGNWSVNGVVSGNQTVGTVVGGSSATYTAPATVPAANPVAVSAQINSPAGLATLVSNIRVFDQAHVYMGTMFGRVETTIQGQTQFVELSANLRFTYNPALSIAGDKWYDGTGTAFVRGRSFGCTGTGSGSAPLQGADLVLHTEGPLAGTYSISAGAQASVTMTCGDPPQVVTVPLQGGAGAGGSDICPAPAIGDDPGRLAGSWFCNVAEGSTARANWTLRAIE